MNRINRTMGLVVVVIYLTMGSLLIFTDYFTIVPTEYRTMSGIVIVAYGMLRAVRYLTSRSDN